MATARSAPAVLLNTGKVLVAGGYACDGSGNCSSLSSVELYDPTAGTFSSAGTMTQARSRQTMTLLGNGTVLIAEGENCTSATSCTAASSAEIYDPVAGTFTATSNSMSAARFNASAVALNSGQVLIAGGFDGTNLPATAELFDPVASQFTGAGPSLATPRFSPTATLLNNGDVLVAGGSTCAARGCPSNVAEIYDPVANTFSGVSGGMTVARFSHTATLTTNGQVYIAGGFSSCGTTCTSEASTEMFDPVAGTFSSGQPVTNALAGQTGTLIANGSVLLIGGISDGVTLSADQWYQPMTLTPSGLVSIAVTPKSAFLTPGQTQQFVATGTFQWRQYADASIGRVDLFESGDGDGQQFSRQCGFRQCAGGRYNHDYRDRWRCWRLRISDGRHAGLNNGLANEPLYLRGVNSTALGHRHIL